MSQKIKNNRHNILLFSNTRKQMFIRVTFEHSIFMHIFASVGVISSVSENMEFTCSTTWKSRVSEVEGRASGVFP